MNDKAEETDWATLLLDHRDQYGMSQKQLAEHCQLSVFTIRRIEQGDEPRIPEMVKIRKYFESLPVEDEKLPLPKSGLDETSMTLMARVEKHCCAIERVEGLAKNLISRLHDRDPEVTVVLARNLLRQYIASIETPEERHTVLLQLLDVGNG